LQCIARLRNAVVVCSTTPPSREFDSPEEHVLAVRWTLKDSAEKLNEFVREEIIAHDVPEDRQDWLHREIVRQIRKEVKKKLKKERIKRAGSSAQKEQKKDLARRRLAGR